MILVTGAAGKTGLALIKSLTADGLDARAMIHRPEREKQVRSAGATEIQIGDMENRSDMAIAFKGVERVYFIVPNVHPNEIEIGKTAIAEAKKAGTQHFVYHSVLFPQIEDMPHHWRKLRVEEALIQSGLAFSILQPANYMQNILAYWKSIETEGLIRLPYSVEALSSPVDLLDVAEVATKILSSEAHIGASYDLAGPQKLSFAQMAAQIGSHLAKDVQAKEIALQDWQSSVRAEGLDEERLQTLSQMFSYYEDHHFAGNPQALTQLLGRQPSTFADFLAGM